MFACTLRYFIIVIMLTYLTCLASKMLVRCFSVESVYKIKSILSIMFRAINWAVCIQLSHLSYDDCDNTGTLSYYHHQLGSMTHLGLGYEIMVCAVCLSISLWTPEAVQKQIPPYRYQESNYRATTASWRDCLYLMYEQTPVLMSYLHHIQPESSQNYLAILDGLEIKTYF